MSHRGDEHLGELATALVDGALGHDARDAALAHLTRCSECRAEVDAERRLKARLSRTPDPQPPGDLSQRLLAIARVTHPEDSDGQLPWLPEMARFSGPAGATAAALTGGRAAGEGGGRRTGATRRPGGASRPGRRVHTEARRRPPARRLVGRVAGGVTALALGVGGIVLVLPHNRPAAVAPPVASFTVEHASTTGGLPGADPAAGAVVVVSTGR